MRIWNVAWPTAILLPSACRLTDNNRREQTRLVTNSATTSPSPVSEQRSPPTSPEHARSVSGPKESAHEKANFRLDNVYASCVSRCPWSIRTVQSSENGRTREASAEIPKGIQDRDRLLARSEERRVGKESRLQRRRES